MTWRNMAELREDHGNIMLNHVYSLFKPTAILIMKSPQLIYAGSTYMASILTAAAASSVAYLQLNIILSEYIIYIHLRYNPGIQCMVGDVCVCVVQWHIRTNGVLSDVAAFGNEHCALCCDIFLFGVDACLAID